MKDSNSRTYTGGCHCGAVRFQVTVAELKAIDCNCSICQKKGFLHIIVREDNFILLRGEGNLATYMFNTLTARHYFCKTCGMHPFYRPRSHPDCIDVNLRCLDGEVMGDFLVEPFDGRNWENNIDKIR